MARSLVEGGRGGAGYRGGGGAPGKEEATGASEVDGGAPACFFGFSPFFLYFCFSPLLHFYLCAFFLHAAEHVILPSLIYNQQHEHRNGQHR